MLQKTAKVKGGAVAEKKEKTGFLHEMKTNGALYLIMLPGILFFIIFHYIPMGGLVIAFQDFKIIAGIFGSPFVGLANFKYLLTTNFDYLLMVIKNTLLLNVLFITFSTVFAVVLAIMFSEIKQKYVKKVAQTISILPYFISWTVIALFLEAFLKTDGGMFSMWLEEIGHPISFYSDPSVWVALLVFLKIWQGAGYLAIVYIATITGIDTGIYEAATIDGASRWQQILFLTIPILRPTIILMTLFSVGRIFNGDFGMIYGLIGDNSLLYSTTDVIDTYVYRMMRTMGNYSMSSALGMIQSVVGMAFVLTANMLTKKFEPEAAIF